MHGVQQHPRYRVSLPVALVTPSGQVEELALEDISLGGVFVRTRLPTPEGSVVRIHLPVDDGPLSLTGRVVHVIDDARSHAKHHAPGMGVQFDGLSEDTQRSLARFVEALVARQQRDRFARDAATAPRFVDQAHVEVPADRAVIARLWAAGLERGAFRARGKARLGNRVAVCIGPLTLTADVVGVDDEAAGATLRVVDLRGAKRAALARFISGETPSIVMRTEDTNERDLAAVLADARRLFVHLERQDPFGALGLPACATDDALGARIADLARTFSAEHPDASPPQRARLQAATKAIIELEASLLPLALFSDVIDCGVTDVFARGEESAPDTQVHDVAAAGAATEVQREEIAELIAEAEFLESTGRPDEAQRALLEARELAPNDTGVTRRLTTLADSHAAALLDEVDRLSRDERIARARKATRLSSSRKILLRAMGMLASAEALDDMLAVAEHLADLCPEDELPLFAMLRVNERTERWAAAARAGEALMRLRPDDDSLRARVAGLVAAARAEKAKAR